MGTGTGVRYQIKVVSKVLLENFDFCLVQGIEFLKSNSRTSLIFRFRIVPKYSRAGTKENLRRGCKD